MGLCGTGAGHCCWFSGGACDYVKPATKPGFRWACTLRDKYGAWAKVHASDEYTSDVRDKMQAVGGLGLDCGDWPPKGIKCGDCGNGDTNNS